MTQLESITEPKDLLGLDYAQLEQLAAEIREFLVHNVTRTGGHLGPNLGVVELTIALHRVFDSPRDTILWDVGHQTYVHKILTGRASEFGGLRKRGGLSGYPSRSESVHDHIEHSHASAALSYAAGIARADRLHDEPSRHVVAVVGDGALTGGMSWEALNDLAGNPALPVIIVVNDNGRSYSPTVGGLATQLAALRTNRGYERALHDVKRLLRGRGPLRKITYRVLHALKAGVKDAVAPQSLFEDLGMKYLGPIDGHDVPSMERSLRLATRYRGPVIVHCVTRKGRGYQPAELDPVDHLHGIGAAGAATGKPAAPSAPTWSAAFGAALAELGETRGDVVAVTAAMADSVGLRPFATAYPDRFVDVGIAEQHAVGAAAGLAMRGLHPVVAIYSTFLHRAVDQILMDVALHRLPVTLVVDRTGVTGEDGPSHNGLWDMVLLHAVPGLRIAAPRDGSTLRQLLHEAVATDGPTAIRFPKGRVDPDYPVLRSRGTVDILREDATGGRDVLLVAVGAMAGAALDAADQLLAHGVGSTVVSPRWIAPSPPELATLAADHAVVVTVEDGLRSGGVGSHLAQALRDAAVPTPVHTIGIRDGFPAQASRQELLQQEGLDAPTIARDVLRALRECARTATWQVDGAAGLPGRPARETTHR